MTDTKIPMRIFTSYEALTEYYGERPDMELGLYVSDEKLLVGHAPTAYSFNPQYFTGVNELEPNYVPASPIDYTINVAPNDTTYGYATGGGTYPEHTEITVNAYAYYGYKFDKWSNDVETSAYTFAVEEDADLTAYFVDNTYTVTTKPSAPGIGTTTGDGVYIAGTSVTVTATPAEGYYFADIWFDLDTLEIVSTDAEYTFTVEKNTNLRANFDIYRVVSATSNNSDYGSTTGAGQYKAGTLITVTATPNENYRFVNWTNNGTEVSTDAEYTFTVYDDTALVANFALITYTVTVSANDSSYGTVTGGGEYARGSNVTINAIPNSGYNFVNWTQGGIQVVTHPEYTFTILSDADFVANFVQTITITTSTSTGHGTVSAGGTFPSGSAYTLVSTPDSGYRIARVLQNGLPVLSPKTSMTFTLTSNTTFVVEFEEITYTVYTSANPTEGGTTTGDGTYSSSAQVTITATPNEGYVFQKWQYRTKGWGSWYYLTSNATYTFDGLAENRNCQAVFTTVQT